MRNIQQNSEHYQDLVNGGGKRTVPCLLIEENGKQDWLYESRDIISYLKQI
jgi:glutathione S-transferase